MDLLIVGMNHRTAPLDIRERVALNEDEIKHTLSALREQQIFAESMLLSTCNRTELYGIAADPEEGAERARRFLNEARQVDYFTNGSHAYVHRERSAVRHLLRVAAGLDSMVLGEPQIFGQVKDAYTTACDCLSAGSLLHRLSHLAFRVGKQVRTETALGAGAVSVGYTAVELAGKIFRDIQKHNALLIGSGETGELAARHLQERGIKELIIANRTREHADRLAGVLGGRTAPFEHLEDVLTEVDVVISTTAAPHAVVSLEQMQRVMRQRKARSILMIDIAVPRDIEPAVRDLDNVYLYDIDNLQSIVDQNLEKRNAAVPQAEVIIEEAVTQHYAWLQQLGVTPMIKILREHFDAIRQREIDKNGKHFRPEDREQLDKFTHSLIQRLLHEPTTALRGYSSDDPLYLTRIETLCELFKLKPGNDEEK